MSLTCGTPVNSYCAQLVVVLAARLTTVLYRRSDQLITLSEPVMCGIILARGKRQLITYSNKQLRSYKACDTPDSLVVGGLQSVHTASIHPVQRHVYATLRTGSQGSEFVFEDQVCSSRIQNHGPLPRVQQ